MKEKIVNKLTYEEKIIMLYNYCDKNSANANLAKDMSNLIAKAIKLGDVLTLTIIDDILDKHTIIRTKPYYPNKECKLTPNGPKVLASFKPAIIDFKPDQTIFDKIEILTRYINYEMAKKEKNTCSQM